MLNCLVVIFGVKSIIPETSHGKGNNNKSGELVRSSVVGYEKDIALTYLLAASDAATLSIFSSTMAIVIKMNSASKFDAF